MKELILNIILLTTILFLFGLFLWLTWLFYNEVVSIDFVKLIGAGFRAGVLTVAIGVIAGSIFMLIASFLE